MMNPSEIDAGPPNKKPKMVGGVGVGVVVGAGGVANTNGYQSQISESKEQMFAAIESEFPDELVTENEYSNTYHPPPPPPPQQQQQQQHNAYVVNDSLNTAQPPQQAFQIKSQQQLQYKIMNGPNAGGPYQQTTTVVQQQQSQQQGSIHLTNSPNRASSTGPSPMGMSNASNTGVGINYQIMNASGGTVVMGGGGVQQQLQQQQTNLKPAVAGQILNPNFQQQQNANYHAKMQQQPMAVGPGGIKNPSVVANNGGSLPNPSSSPASMQQQQQSVPMNTTFHSVGNVNINNINIHIQPNAAAANAQQQQQQQQGRYVQPNQGGMYATNNTLNQPSPSTTPSSNSISATIAGVASGTAVGPPGSNTTTTTTTTTTSISANATNIRPMLANPNRTIINSNTTTANQNININSMQQQHQLRPTLNSADMSSQQHDRFGVGIGGQMNASNAQMNGQMTTTTAATVANATFVNRPPLQQQQQQQHPQTIHLQGPQSIRQQLTNGPSSVVPVNTSVVNTNNNNTIQHNPQLNSNNSMNMQQQLGNNSMNTVLNPNNINNNSNSSANNNTMVVTSSSSSNQQPVSNANPSSSSAVAPAGGSGGGSSNEQEKRKLIQQQLVLLLHAHKCSQRSDKQCQVPHCSTMRGVLAHMTQCNEGRNCTVAHCASSRQIIGHWKNCTKPDCPVCNPLRNQNAAVAAGNATQGLQRPGGVPGMPNMAPGNSLQQQQPGLGGQPGKMPSMAAIEPNQQPGQASTGGGAAPIPMQHQPQQPREHKPWHDKITTDMRRHLVQKIVQTIFPTQDPNIYRDPRLTNLVNYAVKTECEMYEQARDQEEYFHLLAERIYKIQKEFEDKTRSRNSRNATAGGGANSQTGDNNGMSASSSSNHVDSGSLFHSQLNVCNPDLSAGDGGPPNKVAPSDSSKPFSNGPSMANRSAAAALDPFKINPTPNAKLPNSVQMFKAEFDATNPFNSSSSAVATGPLNQSPSSVNHVLPPHMSQQQQQQQPSSNNHFMAGTVTASSSLDSFNTNFATLNKIDTSFIKKDDTALDVKSETTTGAAGNDAATKSAADNALSIKTEPTGAVDLVKSELISPNKSATAVSVKAEGQLDDSANADPSTANANPASNQPAAASSSISPSKPAQPSIATTTKGTNNKPTIKFPAEYLRDKLMPTFEKMYKEPDSAAFQNPVDPAELMLHDYFDIVKKPMDLSTIRKKLDEGKYSNPQEYVEDVWLMFNNAWLYNKKTSKVYKCCTKLSEIFSSCIDPVMKEMGYCCGQQYTFSPQVLFCYGNQMCCTIPRDGIYYLYNNTNQSTPNANCDKYTYCIKCFDAIKSDTAPIGDDPSQPLIEVKKSQFVQMKNDHEEPEAFVDCTECGRRSHQICALYMEQIFSKFVCETCTKEKSLPNNSRNNQFTSSKLITTQLGDFLESRVNNFLSRNAGQTQAPDYQPAGRVTIRILSSVDKICEVKGMMKQRFEGELQSEQFPFKTKAIFAFEEIDGTDVVFFGMHVQEYGSECSPPNTRRVYISYLDSVFFFRPKELRTAVYHELLIGYLDYVKRLGYQWAHIWACPPSEGDDYIFHCHPVEQKVPKPKRLQDWYKKMLDKGIIERVVIDYKDIHKDAIENGMKQPTDIPYFEGDFWPNVLEECIKESEQEEEKRRKEEAEAAAAAANDDFTPGGDDSFGDGTEGAAKDGANASNGKKKGLNNQQQKKKNIKNKMSQRKSVKKVGSSNTDLMTKILSTMEKHKEVFFVIRLLDSKQVAQMGPIVDKDPSISCDLMNGRDEFLNFARDKHHEFSTLRRAKYSSMALLYELHTQNNEKFVYTCNHCKTQMDARYHCTVCEDYDLCPSCYETKGHVHKMDKLVGPGPNGPHGSHGAGAHGSHDHNKSSNDPNKALDAKQQQQKTKPYIEMYLNTFMHAVNCRNANCTYPKCMQFKRVVQHSKQCQKYKNSQCEFCRQLIALCIYHAKGCKDDACQVPFCSSIKIKLKQQKALNSQAERRRMIKMNKTLRQSANMSSMMNNSNNNNNNNPSSPVGGGDGTDAPGPSTSMQQQQQQQHGGMVPGQGVMGPGGMVNMQPGGHVVIQQSPSGGMSNGMHPAQQQHMMQQQQQHGGMNNNMGGYQQGGVGGAPMMSGQTMNYQPQPHQQQQQQGGNMYVGQQQTPQQYQQQHPMHSQSTNNLQPQQAQYAAQQSPYHQQQNMHQQQGGHNMQQQAHMQTPPQQQHLITSSSSPSLINNPQQAQYGGGQQQQQVPLQNHSQSNLILNNSSNNPIATSSPTAMSSFINANPQQIVDSPGKANIMLMQSQQQQQQAPGGGINMNSMRPQQQMTPSPSPNVVGFNQGGQQRMMNPGSNNPTAYDMAGNVVNSNYGGGPAGYAAAGANTGQINSNAVGGVSVGGAGNQTQYQQQPGFVGQGNAQMVTVNNTGAGAPLQPQQQGQPGVAPTNQEYVESLIERLKRAPNTVERNNVLLEMKTSAPHIYNKLMAQNQQQALLRQQQQRQMNAGGQQNAAPGGGGMQQMAGGPQQQQQAGYVQQQQQQPPQQQQWANQTSMQPGQQAAQPQYVTVQQGGQQATQVLQPQQQQQQPIRYASQPMQAGQQMGVGQQQQQQPRQMMMTNVVGQQQQQMQMQPQQMGQPRMMGQPQQQGVQQMGMPPQQQRMQMQPQQMGQQIRPNMYGQHPQQQQQQQNAMHVQQQQQVHYQQQDPQMMNQTRDLLLQQPGGNMSSPNNPNNPNQHMNPTDKLTQVVDNL